MTSGGAGDVVRTTLKGMNRWSLAVVSVLALAACGDDAGGHDAGGEHAHEHEHGQEGDAAATIDFGEPVPASEADREVRVTASDPFEFSPERIEVAAGDVVTFVVTNEGKAPHEFVLGDHDYQDAHAEEMAGGGHHDDANAVTVAPGETGRVTWRFTEAGRLLFACHQPGHYAGGMLGTLEIAPR